MRVPVLLTVLLTGVLSASEPEITVVVSDQDGERLPGARATLMPWQGKGKPSAATTDLLGKAHLQVDLLEETPEGFEIEVTKPGYFSESVDAIAAPGTQLVCEVTLIQKHLTTLKFLELDGSPAAHRRAVLHSWDTVFTDSAGEFTFSHPPLRKPVRVDFREQVFYVEPEDAGAKIELRVSSPPTIRSQLSMFVNQLDYPGAGDPVATVRGQLITTKGTPATGWLVAQQVTRGPGISSGSFLIAGAEHYDFYYRDLSPVGKDGSFELNPAVEDLFLLSPEGMPFRYPLNPSAWQDKNGLKRTTITVPELESVPVHLRLGSQDGQPARGIQAIPSLGQTYDQWTLRPLQTSDRRRGYYADLPPSPEINNSLRAVRSSDENGLIHVPLHPWRSVRSMAVFPSATSPTLGHDGYWSWPSPLVEGATAFYRLPTNPSVAKPDTALKYLSFSSLRDSNRQPVTLERLRWTLHLDKDLNLAGKGGFIATEDGYRLPIAAGAGKLSFHYRNPRGITETLTIQLPAGATDTDPTAVQLEREIDDPPSLSGRVLDQFGKPAADIRLHLTDESATDANKKYLQMIALSNRAGEFRFKEAPGTCGMTISAVREGHHFRLDGAIDVPEITPENREIQIRMRPTGSVTIRLLDVKALPDHLLLLEQGKDAGRGERHRAVPTASDRSTYHSPFVVPGHYKIAYYTEKFELIELGEAAVEPRQKSTVELRSPAPLKDPPQRPALYPVRVTVTRDGKPAAGVIVKSTPYQEEFYRQQVTTYTGDTSDRSGHAEFLARAGTKWRFAAMDHELNLATSTIEIDPGDNDLRIELRPKQSEANENDLVHARAMFGLPEK